MITHIRMKNFKSWKDSGTVKLAPLTGFFGTNSSGKSSLLQMLLLFKQTIGTDEILFFGDENSLVNLGSFREVIHEHKSKEILGFGIWVQTQPFNYPGILEIPSRYLLHWTLLLTLLSKKKTAETIIEQTFVTVIRNLS